VAVETGREAARTSDFRRSRAWLFAIVVRSSRCHLRIVRSTLLMRQARPRLRRAGLGWARFAAPMLRPRKSEGSLFRTGRYGLGSFLHNLLRISGPHRPLVQYCTVKSCGKPSTPALQPPASSHSRAALVLISSRLRAWQAPPGGRCPARIPVRMHLSASLHLTPGKAPYHHSSL
jgi:hypothetical protein